MHEEKDSYGKEENERADEESQLEMQIPNEPVEIGLHCVMAFFSRFRRAVKFIASYSFLPMNP